MKRDMDLIRDILLEIEKSSDESNRIEIHSVGEYSSSEINGHLKLLVDVGYVDANTISSFEGTTYLIRGLTWDGHEFLNDVRSENVWSGVKEKLKRVGGSASLSVIKQVAAEISKRLMD